MTATVWSKVSRYFTSEPESAIVVNHSPSDSASGAGSACPTSAASSTIGGRPQPTVEVVVQQHLRAPAGPAPG